MATRAARRHPDRHPKSSVVVSYIHPGEVDGEFCDSLIGMLLYDHRNNARILDPPGGQISLFSGPRVAEARSQIVDGFLNTQFFKGAEWLLMIDSDMTFDADTLDRMLEVADPETCPILGGLCFAGSPATKIYPTVYRLVQEDGFAGVEPVLDYPKDSLVKVGATGAAFLLVHRSVFLRMAAPHPHGFGSFPDGVANPYPWFVEGGTTKGRPYGEDIAFCMRANALNIPVHVHTGIKIGHVKRFTLTESSFEERREAGPKNSGENRLPEVQISHDPDDGPGVGDRLAGLEPSGVSSA